MVGPDDPRGLSQPRWLSGGTGGRGVALEGPLSALQPLPSFAALVFREAARARQHHRLHRVAVGSAAHTHQRAVPEVLGAAGPPSCGGEDAGQPPTHPRPPDPTALPPPRSLTDVAQPLTCSPRGHLQQQQQQQRQRQPTQRAGTAGPHGASDGRCRHAVSGGGHQEGPPHVGRNPCWNSPRCHPNSAREPQGPPPPQDGHPRASPISAHRRSQPLPAAPCAPILSLPLLSPSLPMAPPPHTPRPTAALGSPHGTAPGWVGRGGAGVPHAPPKPPEP